jgi:hypothetical protein
MLVSMFRKDFLRDLCEVVGILDTSFCGEEVKTQKKERS